MTTTTHCSVLRADMLLPTAAPLPSTAAATSRWPMHPPPPPLRPCVQALDLSKQQEITKQIESKEREAEFRKQMALLEKEREQVRFQEEKQLEEQRAQVSSPRPPWT